MIDRPRNPNGGIVRDERARLDRWNEIPAVYLIRDLLAA